MTGTASSTLEFYDSTKVSAIPASAKYAALYQNGEFAASPGDIRRFVGHLLIGVLHGQDDQAESCDVLDVERYDAWATDAPGFIRTRNALKRSTPIIYGSASTIAAVLDALAKSDQWLMRWGLWLAWPWRRGNPPTRAYAYEQLMRYSAYPISARRLHAVQWHWGGDYDTSVWYGTGQFTRPIVHQAGLEFPSD